MRQSFNRWLVLILLFLIGVCWPAAVRAQAFDLSALKAKDGPFYYLVIRNIGAPILPGYSVLVSDKIPSGIIVTSITALGWTCQPLPPVIGPNLIKCTFPVLLMVVSGAYLPSIKLGFNGTPKAPNCYEVRLVDSSGKGIVESNMKNNVACSK
jgi:hypothetical protein